jgi:hypothetical protein
MSLTGGIMPVRDVTAAQRAEMWALLDRHFEGVHEEDFEADLAEKNWVVAAWDGAGRLVGFSTLLLYRSSAAGEARWVLFSGDTIADPRAWHSPVPVRCWVRSVFGLAAEVRADPLDWFLLSSGHRTYRIMTTLFREHHPSRYTGAPGRQARLAAYARERYGQAFDDARGIVKLRRSIHRLRPGIGDLTPARRLDPDAAFFASRNPGHVDGDELCCLCEISERNLTPAGWRLLGRP